MPRPVNRCLVLLVVGGLALGGLSACSAPDETDPGSSPQGNLDDGAELEDPTATDDTESGGETDASPEGEEPEMGGELGDVQGDDGDDGGE